MMDFQESRYALPADGLVVETSEKRRLVRFDRIWLDNDKATVTAEPRWWRFAEKKEGK